MDKFSDQKKLASSWFRELREEICNRFEKIEKDSGSSATFTRKKWDRDGGGVVKCQLCEAQFLKRLV